MGKRREAWRVGVLEVVGGLNCCPGSSEMIDTSYLAREIHCQKTGESSFLGGFFCQITAKLIQARPWHPKNLLRQA